MTYKKYVAPLNVFPSEAHKALFTEFETYLDNLRTEGRSEETVRSYTCTYRKYCRTSSVIEDRRVRRFLLQYENLNTRNKMLAHLKAFVVWYGSGNEFVLAPIRVRTVKLPDRAPHTIESGHADKLLAHLYMSYRPAWAVLTIMRETGMRIGEVCGLKDENLYEEAGETTPYGVRFVGKGNKQRAVPLTDTALAAFRYWTSCSQPTTRTIRRYIEMAEKEIGVEHIKPHWFRSTLATNLVNHGVAFDEVAELLGHSSTDILRKRYARLGHSRLADILRSK